MNLTIETRISALLLVVFSGSLFAFQNCAGPISGSSESVSTAAQTGGAGASTVSKNDLDSELAQIELLNSQDLSCSGVSDCVAVSLGMKACGGPQMYLVSSINNRNAAQIKNLIATYTQNQIAYDKQNGAVSTCELTEPPSPLCVASACR